MKQFLLFDYHLDAPAGGWDDCVKSSDQITELMDTEMTHNFQEIVHLPSGRVILTRTDKHYYWIGEQSVPNAAIKVEIKKDEEDG